MRTYEWQSVIIYIDIKNVSPRFLSYLHELIDTNERVYLHKVATFEFKGINQYKELIKSVKHNIKNSNIEVYLYIQSLDQILCRFLANSYFKYSANVFIVGLQFSLPVFLFRDPRYVAQLVNNKEFKDFLISRADKIKSTKNNSMLLLTKKFFLKIIEYLFDLFFLEKKFRSNRMVRATSYVQRGVVDLHLVGKNFYKFCLKQIYHEPVKLLGVIKQSNSYMNNNSIEIYDNLDLIILGPVSHLMADCYVMDIKKLISINYKFRNIYIKPHPRFKSLASKLVDQIRTQKIEGVHKKSICIMDQIPRDVGSLLVMGYYSSLFDELVNSDYKGLCIISERATHCRYPEMPVNVLSGEKFGFGNPHLVLDYKGNLINSRQ